MIESGDYPMGTEFDPKAPWNEVELPEKEIEVLVSITFSKNVKIKVNDYTIMDEGIDEDGYHFENLDFSGCDLKGAVENQVDISFEGWNIDDLEVVIEEN